MQLPIDDIASVLGSNVIPSVVKILRLEAPDDGVNITADFSKHSHSMAGCSPSISRCWLSLEMIFESQFLRPTVVPQLVIIPMAT